ncbi:MAG: hypothetical protein KME11_09375 [Timaviella obliquedivisa GSE-PSE-MK23-08B]|jgi:hypothetical protein|nr:hypothetical protein [Timaviella obliquedivisa GSE-PSE-MK23-08B]
MQETVKDRRATLLERLVISESQRELRFLCSLKEEAKGLSAARETSP